MKDKALQKNFEDLQTRMRILILQNRSETQEYDEAFLSEIHDVSARLLWLKKRLLNACEKEEAFFRMGKHLTGV